MYLKTVFCLEMKNKYTMNHNFKHSSHAATMPVVWYDEFDILYIKMLVLYNTATQNLVLKTTIVIHGLCLIILGDYTIKEYSSVLASRLNMAFYSELLISCHTKTLVIGFVSDFLLQPVVHFLLVLWRKHVGEQPHRRRCDGCSSTFQ